MKKKKTKLQKILILIWIIIAIAIVIFVCEKIGYNSKRIKKTATTLIKLWLMGYVATFIGGIFEFRSWMKYIAYIAKPFIRYGRFSEVSGASFLTSFISNKAANSLIISSYNDGRMSRREMFLCAACNSYGALLSHSLRIMFGFIGLSGIVGVYYYSFNLGTGLLLTLFFVALNSYLTKRSKKIKIHSLKNDNEIEKIEEKIQHKILDWETTLRKSNKRGWNLVLRMLIVSTPLYFLSQYLIISGVFKNIENTMPTLIANFITPEILSILVARLGGLSSAANIGGALMNDGGISQLEFLMALIIGNIITNPIRTIRRNLPTALSMFPGSNGLYLVVIMQLLRLMLAIIAVIIIVFIIASGAK